MNIVQAQVAHAIRGHFEREDRLMPRNGPVDKFNLDQSIFVDDMVKIFSHQNNLFDKDSFCDIIYEGRR